MSSINVISINPAQNATSALHPEVFERIARECRFNRDVKTFNMTTSKTINLILGINKSVTNLKSSILLALRSLAGASLITTAFLNGLDFSAFSTSWIYLIFGITIICGLFTRIFSFSMAVYSAFMIYSAVLLNQIPDIQTIIGAATALLFFVTGPGKFSTDQFTRLFLLKRSKVRSIRKAEKLAARRLSYQSMRYI